jgi:ABC-2 type transport system permease protein
MSTRDTFSVSRFVAMVVKEFIQMLRDRVTFGMMVGIPLIQLVLFGYAINSDPKHLPAAVLLADHGPQGRTLLSAIKNSSYFDFVRELSSEAEARDVLARGEVQFVVDIPQDFSRDLLRGARPTILLEADASDPAATSNATNAVRSLLDTAFRNDFKGPLAWLATVPGAIDLRVHALYNPEGTRSTTSCPG